MLKKIALAILIVTMHSMTTINSASAEPPVSCEAPSQVDPLSGRCMVIASAPGKPTPSGDSTQPIKDGGGGSGGSGGGSAAPQVCEFNGDEVPCTSEQGYWSNGNECYVKAAPAGSVDPQDPVWEGNYPRGAIYDCINPDIGAGVTAGTGLVYRFWAAAPPAGAAAPPDPEVLAQQAIAAMDLRAVEIGIVPENTPGSIGIIGLPTWMWVADPGEATTGPITRTAALEGYSVSATATMTQVVWTMGDGSSVTCAGSGTPYADSYDTQSSPTCGHTYTQMGRYPVTATSYWAVNWEGIGQSGVIPLTFAQTTQIAMGEAQVLTQ